ncbi:nucleotide-binding universal stress UspA family protein [Rhizobium sp. ERR 922]|uniref:Universal stress protein n=1 Tax=Rhizobium dioscoreae TaxID=2653122 RepID=A0ABQ0Z600_9HYPH|nr:MULTISPECIES: universal stress protein [Rhizobium]TWB53218.1 nucleotide-binding universal stress UspA family protein [Rhizobium sp. ERR 922]TWB95817.1 nucleotide-binding universal stress UspA family protein [Rhizobium sp. ERR 942]GES40763.1 universal stress protein [Rhizobium dioscoreae]GES50890.1 universal stress protein [Rhizobium dioscoreae]GLU82340.1 universal stress protein [Rhizobium sp. NBRC 114257]
MYRSIVCAVGLGSKEKAEHLVHMASQLLDADGTLHVAHTVERFPSLVRQGPDEWAVSVIGEAEEKLSLLCRELSTPALVHVRTGRAADTILAIAAETKADLIIVAAHATDIFDRVFGSTVDHIVHHAKCSVHIDRILTAPKS